MKKIIIFLLAAVCLFVLISCVPEEVVNGTAPPQAAEAETTSEPTAPELVLVDGRKTDFKVVRAEGAKGFAFDTATAFNKRLRDRISPDFIITDDWVSPKKPSPEKDHEILLFETNRAESLAAMADLNFHGYIIRVTDCKIVIVGTSPAACSEALYHFVDTMIPEHTKEGKISFPIGLEVKQEFKASDLDLAKALRQGKPLCADFNVLFNYPKKDGFTAAQGSATDGVHAYVVMMDSSGEREVGRIVKIDMRTWEVVQESETMVLDHANDMTYDPATKQLIVTNMYDNLISIIDAETLTLVEQKKLPYGTYGAGYIDGSEKYAFLGYGSVGGLVITDKDFNVVRSTPLDSVTDYVGQGMDADAKYAYVPLSPKSGIDHNIIQIYDITSGDFLGNAIVKTTMESESMFHVGNDIYMHFNNAGSKIAKLEFYIRFE
jgi:hypothetical protein